VLGTFPRLRATADVSSEALLTSAVKLQREAARQHPRLRPKVPSTFLRLRHDVSSEALLTSSAKPTAVSAEGAR
jgi:hypothetical protein